MASIAIVGFKTYLKIVKYLVVVRRFLGNIFCLQKNLSVPSDCKSTPDKSRQPECFLKSLCLYTMPYTTNSNRKLKRNICDTNGFQNSVCRDNNHEKIATTKWMKRDAREQKLVNFDQMPSFFREPFILSAYRQCNSSPLYCIKSLFQTTNETMNIWSHGLALVVFILRFVPVFAKHDPWQDSRIYPLLYFAFGICSMLVMTVGAHLFNCMSIKARHICFFFDYSAISVYTFTAGQVIYFYSRPANANWVIFNTPSVFLGISATISLASTLACCFSLTKRNRFDAVVKAGTYTSAWLFNTSPYLIMLLTCETATCLFYAGATLAYVTGIPERLIIGVFDVGLDTVINFCTYWALLD